MAGGAASIAQRRPHRLPARAGGGTASAAIRWCLIAIAVVFLVFVLVLYLRHGLHLRGRRLAFLTIVTFALLLFTLAAPSHHFLQGGGP